MAKKRRSSGGLPIGTEPLTPADTVPAGGDWRTERRAWIAEGSGYVRGPWEVVAAGDEWTCREALRQGRSVDAAMTDLRLWCGETIILQITR